MISEQISPIGYSYKALAEATGLSVSFWRREVRLGRIPFVRFDQAVLILPADLAEYFAQRRQVKSERAQDVQEGNFQVTA